jgi:lactoylglutathione lyase
MDLIHVRLRVADADESAEWYVEQLDFERSWEFESDGARHVYVADGEGFELQLTDEEGVDAIDEADRFDHLAVGVDDADEAFEAIENYGVIKEPADQPAAGARTAFVEDPDGHVVELVQPLED